MKKEPKNKLPTYHATVTFLSAKEASAPIASMQLNLRAESREDADIVVVKEATRIWPCFKWVLDEIL